ncbi:hypothetical protein LJB42_002607 [Komagataella kurtzmanii]|nr:hypothetical protein LJB42_002607 [Komagataella kurtzmanii]
MSSYRDFDYGSTDQIVMPGAFPVDPRSTRTVTINVINQFKFQRRTLQREFLYALSVLTVIEILASFYHHSSILRLIIIASFQLVAELPDINTGRYDFTQDSVFKYFCLVFWHLFYMVSDGRGHIFNIYDVPLSDFISKVSVPNLPPQVHDSLSVLKSFINNHNTKLALYHSDASYVYQTAKIRTINISLIGQLADWSRYQFIFNELFILVLQLIMLTLNTKSFTLTNGQDDSQRVDIEGYVIDGDERTDVFEDGYQSNVKVYEITVLSNISFSELRNWIFHRIKYLRE